MSKNRGAGVCSIVIYCKPMRGSDKYPTDLSITGTYIVLFRISNVPPIDYIIKESERLMDVILFKLSL